MRLNEQDVSGMAERVRRVECRLVGHDAVIVDGEPVTTFACCRRCGKFARVSPSTALPARLAG